MPHAQLLASLCLPEADVDWVELARMSRVQNSLEQALYCYNKAIRSGPADMVCLYVVMFISKEIEFERNAVLVALGRYQRALDGYAVMLSAAPGDLRVNGGS